MKMQVLLWCFCGWILRTQQSCRFWIRLMGPKDPSGTFNYLLEESWAEWGSQSRSESEVLSIVSGSLPLISVGSGCSPALVWALRPSSRPSPDALIVTRIAEIQQVNHFPIAHFSWTDLWYGAGHSATHNPTVQQRPVGNHTSYCHGGKINSCREEIVFIPERIQSPGALNVSVLCLKSLIWSKIQTLLNFVAKIFYLKAKNLLVLFKKKYLFILFPDIQSQIKKTSPWLINWISLVIQFSFFVNIISFCLSQRFSHLIFFLQYSCETWASSRKTPLLWARHANAVQNLQTLSSNKSKSSRKV